MVAVSHDDTINDCAELFEVVHQLRLRRCHRYATNEDLLDVTDARVPTLYKRFRTLTCGFTTFHGVRLLCGN